MSDVVASPGGGLRDEQAPLVPELLWDEGGSHACTACGECIARCPSESLAIESASAEPAASAGPTPEKLSAVTLERFDLDWSRCIGCGECVTHCPEEALTLRIGPLSAALGSVRTTDLLAPGQGAS